MHFVTASWSLADILWNYDPFSRVEHFGPVLSGHEGAPMSAWFQYNGPTHHTDFI